MATGLYLISKTLSKDNIVYTNENEMEARNERRSPLKDSLIDLQETAAQLNAALCELADRLQPIRRIMPKAMQSDKAEDGIAPVSASSNVIQELASTAKELRSMYRYVREIHESLDV